MFETGKREKAAKKAYEIAYAIFRIAAKMEDLGIKEKFQAYAINLLIASKTEEYGNAAKAVAAIDCLIKFAIDLNIVSIANGDVLLREINNMNEAIAECLDKTDEEVDASRFFPEPIAPEKVSGRPKVEIENSFSSRPVGERGPRFQSSANEPKESNVIKSGMRQIAILDKIRQSGNCKLKEIQEVLPDTSERTIRYDIEELIERNLVERIGSGGPAVCYRTRQSVVPVQTGTQTAIRQ